MKKYISVIVSLILSCCLLSCTEEQWLKNGGVTEQQGGLPIEFVMEFAPTQPLTRADGTEITIEGEKTAFENGDIIQIVANFYCKEDLADPNSDIILMPEESICTMLQYQKSESDDMGKWVNYKAENDKDRPLYWPWKSEEATFQAFYYPGFNGYIDGTTLPVLLDSVDVKTNPLMTQETERIPYGNAVSLTFNHICARLVLTDLEDVTGGASYTNLWLENLSTTDDIPRTNAFKLSLKEKNEETNSDPENSKLSFECSFTSEQNEEQKVLIGGKSATISKNNSNEKETAIIFFLPAGNYSKAALTRRFGRPLLNWNNVNDLSSLETGKSYIVSLNELKGNITIEDDDDWWEDDKIAITPEEGYFDLNTFLQCIHDGKSYSYNDSNGKKITVLEKGQDNQLYLTQNIDFDNQDFTSQTIPQAVILNGNGHYFSYVKKSVFSQIDGEVHNLGFKNCTASVDLTKTGINNYRFGILTNTNYGIIDNIRLSEISIHVNSIEDGGTYEVGSLVGDSQGAISNIELDNIKVTTNELDVNSATFAFGGLIGQTTKGGTLEKVTMYTDNNIVVTNSIKLKEGNIYTGGLIGLSSSNIKECSVRADVSTANATGVWIYTGGLVGSMRNQIQGSSGSDTDTSTGDSTETLTEDNTDTSTGDEDHILLESSQNIGTVTGGECIGQVADNIISTGHSATGGLVGYSLRADIKNCIVDGTVSSHIGENNNEPTQAYEFYTIGGLAGAIRAAESGNTKDYPIVENNSVYTDIDSELQQRNDAESTTVHFCKIGWLAGIAPTNVEDEKSNIKFVSTTYKNVGYPSDNAPSTSSSGN